MAEIRKLVAMLIVIYTVVAYWVFRGKLRHA